MLDNVDTHYNLRGIVTKVGWVNVVVRKGMYGLLQAGILAWEPLKECLAKHGYT